MEKRCEKCGFETKEIKQKSGLNFCFICYTFAPDTPEKLDEYILEKVSPDSLNPFRKYVVSHGQKLKQSMIEKAKVGELMSRAPFGYVIIEKKLVPAENFRKVEEIFDEFLNRNTSLNKLANKNNLSINGLKKILTNYTYVGKIKFNGEVHQGSHEPIVSSTLFNHVQDRLEKLKIKKIN